MGKKSVPVRVRPEILEAAAYQQGRRPEKTGFKLSSNENPFETLPEITQAINARLDHNRYAAADMTELRTKIASRFATTAEHVHLGSGSVAILYQLIHTVAGVGDNYVFAWPSFEAYPGLGLASGADPIRVPLQPDATHDLDAMAAAINSRTRAVIVCSPNNPTGPTVSRTDFEAFLQKVPRDVLVVLDEAYAEFVTESEAVIGVDLLRDHENLVVLRTFSKAYGLAGVRIGYGLGSAELWEAVGRIAIPLSISGVAEAAALAALEPATLEKLLDRVRVISERRDTLAHTLRTAGISVPEAQGNFVWIPETDRVTATRVAEAFAEHGTLVRPFVGHGTRITVGEPESVTEAINVLTQLFESAATTAGSEGETA